MQMITCIRSDGPTKREGRPQRTRAHCYTGDMSHRARCFFQRASAAPLSSLPFGAGKKESRASRYDVALVVRFPCARGKPHRIVACVQGGVANGQQQKQDEQAAGQSIGSWQPTTHQRQVHSRRRKDWQGGVDLGKDFQGKAKNRAWPSHEGQRRAQRGPEQNNGRGRASPDRAGPSNGCREAVRYRLPWRGWPYRSVQTGVPARNRRCHLDPPEEPSRGPCRGAVLVSLALRPLCLLPRAWTMALARQAPTRGPPN